VVSSLNWGGGLFRGEGCKHITAYNNRPTSIIGVRETVIRPQLPQGIGIHSLTCVNMLSRPDARSTFSLFDGSIDQKELHPVTKAN